MIEAFRTGRPSWAMDARGFALTWSHAQPQLSRYLDALKEDDLAAATAVGGDLDERLQQLADLAARIKLPSSPRCIQAIEELRQHIRENAVPTPSSVKTVSSFAKEAIC